MNIVAILIIVLMIVIVPVLLVAARATRKQADQAWRRAGAVLGLRHHPGGLLNTRRLEGELHGIRVLVDTFTRSTGKSSTTYTRYRVRYPSLGLGLRLTRQGMLSGLATFLGAQDLRVGDATFDDAVVVKSRAPERVVSFLTPDRRVRVQGLMRSFADCTVGDTEICVNVRGLEKDSGRLQRTLDRMVQTARALLGTGQDPEALGVAAQAQREGRLDEALEVLPGARPGDEPAQDPEAQVLRGEILLASGQYDEAAQVLEGASQTLPDDDQVQELSRQARARAQGAPPVSGAAARSEGSEVVSLAMVCAELFGEGVLSFEAQRRFDEAFQGRWLRAHGRLQSCTRYESDLVFGPGPALRAVVQLTATSAVGSTLAVQAILSLPEHLEPTLGSRYGQELSFEGVLHRCDPLVRNLYLAEIRLAPEGDQSPGS